MRRVWVSCCSKKAKTDSQQPVLFRAPFHPMGPAPRGARLRSQDFVA
jgi:hypothetical protein